MVLNTYGDVLRKNPDASFEDVTYPEYLKKYFVGNSLYNEKTFEMFKNTEYSIEELEKDVKSMENSINNKL